MNVGRPSWIRKALHKKWVKRTTVVTAFVLGAILGVEISKGARLPWFELVSSERLGMGYTTWYSIRSNEVGLTEWSLTRLLRFSRSNDNPHVFIRGRDVACIYSGTLKALQGRIDLPSEPVMAADPTRYVVQVHEFRGLDVPFEERVYMIIVGAKNSLLGR